MEMLPCPWCQAGAEAIDPKPVRMHDDGAEYRCTACGGRHTRKDTDPGSAFLVFPLDIYTAMQRGEGLQALNLEVPPRPPPPPPDPLAEKSIKVYHDEHTPNGSCIVLMGPGNDKMPWGAWFTVARGLTAEAAEQLASGYRQWLSALIRMARG